MPSASFSHTKYKVLHNSTEIRSSSIDVLSIFGTVGRKPLLNIYRHFVTMSVIRNNFFNTW
jgi:hypothetical protein